MPKKKKKFELRITTARVIHTPTYCYLQAIDPITDKPPYYERKKLDNFKMKSDIQSNQSAKRLQQAINWLLLFALPKRVYSKKPFINKRGQKQHSFSFRLAFITLTLSSEQKHSDNFIKEHMLQPFLYWIQRYNQGSYTWKAETQINGNIHFHITTDVFMHWRSIRAKWNSIQQNFGYEKVYQAGSHPDGSNSTDVHCVKNEKEVAKYLASYCTKKSEFTKKDFEKIEKYKIQPQGHWCRFEPRQTEAQRNSTWYKRIISGRIWGCSQSLSNIRCFTDQLDPHYNFAKIEKEFFLDNKLQRLSSLLIAKEIEKHPDISSEQIIELNKKYYSYSKVFIHKNLKFCKLPTVIRDKITAERDKRNFTNQTIFKVESFN